MLIGLLKLVAANQQLQVVTTEAAIHRIFGRHGITFKKTLNACGPQQLDVVEAR